MNIWLIALVTGIYAVTSGTFALGRMWGLAIMFAGYALANIGVIMVAKGGR